MSLWLPPEAAAEPTILAAEAEDDTFSDEHGRDAHMNGEIAKALMAKAPDLFSNEVKIERMEILASK